ncbi:MAG: hypothetical protein KZQ89_08660 [Candidatus Thiodiazotropha sp. (ex Lucinoma kastoroae)]|nr:hypothetical protein [Candidatus Thiodiazotropha sp. (ex Lucinoma kastoroae)]
MLVRSLFLLVTAWQCSSFAAADTPLFQVSPIPLRTAAQKNASVAGGEGFQLVMAIAYAPSDSNIVYMGSDTSQVWKSKDGGQSWDIVNNGYLSLGSRSLFVHPGNPDLVFSAGTLGKAFKQGLSSSFYQGIYRSDDGGTHWEMVQRVPFFKQESRGNLFATDSRTLERTKFTIYTGTHDGDLLVSLDGGFNWRKTGFKTGPILEIIESSNAPGTILVASENGLFRYDGKDATQIGAGLPTWPRSIAVSTDKPGVVYAALGNQGVFKSTDDGRHFEQSLRGSKWNVINDVEVSPVDANVAVYTSSGKAQGPFYTHDGGKQWWPAETIKAKGLTRGGGFYFASPVAFHPTKAKYALTCSNGRARILSTKDGGQRWTYSGSGYLGARLRDVVSLSSQRMIFALTDHGAWRTDDGAKTFAQIEHPRIGGKSIGGGAMSGDTLILTIGSWKTKQLLVSQDGGRSWKDTGLRGLMRFVESHRDDSKVFYVGKYRSQDNGRTWMMLPQRIMAMDPTDNDRVYAMVGTGKMTQLLMSEDRGDHWRKLGSPLPVKHKSVKDLEIDPFSPSRHYLASGRGLFVFDEGKWTARDEQHGLLLDAFNSQYFEAIAAHPGRSGLLFAGKRSPAFGMANGLFYSDDHGERWKPMLTGVLSNTAIWSININPYNGIVFVGTSHGIYKIKVLE